MALVRLLTMPQVAEVLGCSRTHPYALIAAGKLRAVEIAAKGSKSKTRVREDDLQAFIEANTRDTRGGGAGEASHVNGT